MRNHLKTVLQSIADGVYTVDSELIITMWNPAAERITGHKAAEVIGKPCRRVLNHTDEAGNALCESGCPLNQAMQEAQQVSTVVLYARLPGGSRIPLSVSASPLSDDKGHVIGSVQVFRDVSQERELERLKDEILSAISHELRTPLTSIRAYTKTLMREDVTFDEKLKRKMLKVVNFQAERLTRLVGDLLDYSQIEMGGIRLHLDQVSIDDIVRRVVAYMKAQTNNHTFLVRTPLDLPTIRGDADRLEQLVVNLVSNAITYSPDGGRITVSAKSDGRAVHLSVKDQGVGIPEAEQPKVFDKFYSVAGDWQSRSGGTGIGLYVAKAIANGHGGTMGLVSKPGKGATFTVSLPLKGPETKGPETKGPDAERSASASATPRSVRR